MVATTDSSSVLSRSYSRRSKTAVYIAIPPALISVQGGLFVLSLCGVLHSGSWAYEYILYFI